MKANLYSSRFLRRRFRRGRFALGFGLRQWLPALLLATAATQVCAADLRIRVFERGGKAPLQGTSVCLGTRASIKQFGAGLTDADGYAVFSDLPGASLVVTASKPGHMGVQQPLVTSNVDRLLVISLPRGGGGIRCDTSATGPVVAASSFQVENFAINNGASVSADRQVVLNNRVSGDPTHYRASEQADFKDSQWETYTADPGFELSTGAGRKVVYFQVRRFSTINGADIQTISPVVRDSIMLGNH
jgi:hypothetical protein